MLNEWLHPETKEKRAKRIEEERKDMEEMRRRMEAQRIIDLQGPRVELREQNLWQWIAQIEEGERERMETPSERRTRERRQEIRDHRHFLKQYGRFHKIVRTARHTLDGSERREAFRRFWAGLYTAEDEDPLVRTRGEELAIRTADLREYKALEDEERREAGRRLTVVDPPTLLREHGTTIPPQRSGIGAGVARLQD
jgi:hypothetical protein